MRQAKPILAALSIGLVFSALFWLLLASSLGARAASAAPAAHPAIAAREDPAPYPPGTPPPAGPEEPAPYASADAPTSSAAVTFGPIQVVTGSASGPSGTNL